MNQEDPTISHTLSLVLCTYGRTDEADAFLKSLETQTMKSAEIILVDQNEKNILSHNLRKWSTHSSLETQTSKEFLLYKAQNNKTEKDHILK